MTERLIGETGSRKRRRFLLLPVLVIAFISLFVITAAQAVHGEDFQLDGNVLASLGTNVGGTPETVDWDSLFDSAGAEKTLPADFTASGFNPDFRSSGTTFVTSDPSTFATGSKDTLPISGWQCNFDSNVNSKIDVMNSYAATYVDDKGTVSIADDEEIIYFGLERNANTGSANVAFWFLQDDVGCSTTGAAATFTGAHQDGDLLIVSEFSGGGTVSTIVVYEWEGGANGFLNTTPVASGVDCRSASVPATDTVCATANTASISTPWLTAAKTLSPNVGHSLPIAQFFEGGLNLTLADLGGTCFTSFLGDTRSSTSLTATLFDYAGGRLGDCGSGVVTTPSAGHDGAVSIGASGSVSVTDSALLSVNGATTYGGTMTFYLCAPTLLSGSYAPCTTGGTQIGAVKTVVGSSPTTTVVSDAATITSAGRYCWRADYSGDASVGVPASSDSSVGECFRVTPLQPGISTNASGALGVALGTAISDSATLSGATSNAGGSITFRVYGPDDANCSGTAAFTSAAVPVTANGTYSSGSFTPLAAGTYRWIASYTGDAPNTLPIAGVCNAANEASLIQPRQPAIVTVASGAAGVALGTAISDSATLSNTSPKPNGDPAGGTITFRVYGPNDATCSGAAVFTSAAVPVTGNGTYSSGNFTPAAAGTYRWIASYSGDLPNTLAVAGACNDANEASLIISLQPTISTAQSFVPNDSATITVASGGGDLAGNVVFKLYVNNATCAGAATYTSPSISITGAGSTGTAFSRSVLSNNTTAYGATGTTFHWVVEYTSTNGAHQNVTSPCGREHSSITVQNNGS